MTHFVFVHKDRRPIGPKMGLIFLESLPIPVKVRPETAIPPWPFPYIKF